MAATRDKTKIKIIDLLKSYPAGLTITDIIKKLKLSRHTVLSRLHSLVGADKVGIRKINMAISFNKVIRIKKKVIDRGRG